MGYQRRVHGDSSLESQVELTDNGMPSKKSLNCRKTYSTPNRPYEKERLNQELKLIGEYGLRNKKEVWRVKLTLAKVRKAARVLLTLDEKDPKRLFEPQAAVPGLQERSRQVRPPRPCPDQAEAHQGQEASGRRRFLRGQVGQPEAHRL